MSTPICDALRNISLEETKFVFYPNSGWTQFQFYWSLLLFTTYPILILSLFTLKYILPSRNQYYRLQVRPVTFVVLTHLGGIFTVIPGSWHKSTELGTTVPCWVYFISYFLSIPLLVIPVFIRLLNLYRSDYVTSYVLLASNNGVLQVGEGNEVGKNDGNSMKEEESTWKVFLYSTLCCCVTGRKGMHHQNYRQTTIVGNSAALDVVPGRKEIKLYQFWKSKPGSLLAMGLFLFPYIVTVTIFLITNEMVRSNCYGCLTPNNYKIVLNVEAAIALFLLVLAYRMNLKSKDPFGIVREIKLAVWIGGFPASVVLILSSTVDSKLTPGFNFSPFTEFFVFLYCFFQSGYQCILSIRDERNSKKISNSSEGYLLDIKEFEEQILHKGSKFNGLFQDFLAAENSVESLLFLMGIFQWEKDYYNHFGANTSKAIAGKLIRTYVGENSLSPCNLKSSIVRDLQNEVKRETSDISIDVFKQAKSELIHLLFFDAYRRFGLTKEYKDMLGKINAEKHLSIPTL